MRVLILSINFSPELTGIGPYSAAMAEHLARDNDVVVVTGVPHYPEWAVLPGYNKWRSDTRDGNVRVIRLLHYVPRMPTALRRLIYELTWAIRALIAGLTIRTDLVVAVVPALMSPYVARILARFSKAPFTVLVQDVMSASAAQSGVGGGRLVSQSARILEHASLAGASSIATIHPRLAVELARSLPRRPEPRVIYNWTHVSPPCMDRDEARQYFGWPEDRIVALHTGNMGAKQNLEILIDAARHAVANAPDVQFVLVGDGHQRRKIESYAVGCPNVSIADPVDEWFYTAMLQAADVLLVNERPGVHDMSLPSKLTSYLSVGRPIVAATDRGSSTAEFLRESGGGIVVQAGDGAELLGAVVTLAKDTALARGLMRAGREFASLKLSKETAMVAIDEWIEATVAGTSEGGRVNKWKIGWPPRAAPASSAATRSAATRSAASATT